MKIVIDSVFCSNSLCSCWFIVKTKGGEERICLYSVSMSTDSTHNSLRLLISQIFVLEISKRMDFNIKQAIKKESESKS